MIKKFVRSFSLLEAIIALFIIASVLLVIYSSFEYQLTILEEEKNGTIAYLLAERVMNGYPQIFSKKEGEFKDYPIQGFSYQISWESLNPFVKKMVVEIIKGNKVWELKKYVLQKK